MSRSSSPKWGLSHVVIRAWAVPSCRFSAELTDLAPFLFQRKLRESRCRCAEVKKEAKSASGAEMASSGFMGCSEILAYISFSVVYLFLSSIENRDGV